jgi:myosin heavy subunit
MNILQFSAEEIETILKIVAGVLHFGNLKFKAEKIANAEDGASVVNPDVLTLASSLWGVDPDNMANFLTHRNIGRY